MFTIHSNLLYPLHSYDAAHHHYERFAGEASRRKYWRDNSAVMLKDWRDTSKRLIKQSDGSFACTYHHTALVTYHPSGDVTIIGHSSRSSRVFLGRYLPVDISCGSLRECTVLTVREPGGPRMIVPSGPLRLRPAKGGWSIIEGKQLVPVVYTVDRSTQAWVKKRYKAFIKWAGVVEALNCVPPPSNYGEYVATKLLTEEPENPEAWSVALGACRSAKAVLAHLGAHHKAVHPRTAPPSPSAVKRATKFEEIPAELEVTT